MKALLVTLIAVFSCPALAQVDVTVSSSSEDIFVCNVTRTASPMAPSPGSFPGSVSYEDLSSPVSSPWRNRSVGLALNEDSDKLFSFGNQWLSRITRLKMSFSYETMGVGYKVHICYLGPLAQCKGNNGNGEGHGYGNCKNNGNNGNGVGNGNTGEEDFSERIYSLAANVRNSANAYTAAANLYYRVTTSCDLRSGRTDTRQANQVSPGDSMQVDYSYTTNWAAFDGTFRDNVMVLNANWPQRAPKFCEVVFEFKEASAAARSNVLTDNEIELSVDIF
ncbi:pilus assembly protein [Bdellovibrio bacteriovorus]|uniref:pilus assembly protein n=1 Tax=Bdellovibrio bacteriovorus TaxID=959 RepID=UPI0035A6CFF4